MKILIIEDEQLLAGAIAEVLRRKGFEAEAVYDGRPGRNTRSWASTTC